MKKKNIIINSLIAGAASLVIATAIITSTGGVQMNNLIKGNATNARSVIDVTSDSLTLDNSYIVSCESSGFTDGSLFSLSQGGYFQNVVEIRGITSISIDYAAGSNWAKIVPCYYDYDSDEIKDYGAWPEPSITADFSSSPIDYFKIYNSFDDDITITSILITYGCSTASYTFSVSFTPDWNDNTAANHADIYIAGTSELISDGTSSGGWNYKKLTYNNGAYSYNAPNYHSTGIYKYALYAFKNGSSFSWSNKSLDGDQTICLTSNTVDSHSYEWEREPGSADAYTLNIVYNETINGAWSTWRGFTISKTDNSIWNGEYIDNLNYVEGNSYCYTYEFENVSSTVYVTIKMGVSSSGGSYDNCYVGSSSDDSKAIAVTYIGGATTATLTVNKTLSSLSYNYAATSTSIALSGGVSGMSHTNVSLGIYDLDENDTSITNGRVKITPTFESGSDTFTPSFSGSNIRIDKIDGDYYITALKAGTNTDVTLTCDSDNSVSCTFRVNVPSSTYTEHSTRDGSYNGGSQKSSVKEGWFTDHSVSEITDMGQDFFNGVDISSSRALYLYGSNFYDKDGVEQSLFYILKDAGVNWVRLKLWVDPYNDAGVSYGGGESDLNNTLWMAYEAKQAGFKLLLDLHYSDWWTHPSQQVLPKAWKSANSASSLANYIKSYTKNTLNTFNSNGCLPDMVQLGNEISSGSFLQVPGSNDTSFTYYEPRYLTAATSFSYSGTSGSNNMKTYLNAGVEAVSEINSSLSSNIKTVVHWAKGSTCSAAVINSFFSNLSSVNYDYAAISFYPYYCFDTMSEATSILSGLSISKPWFVAETSYPFSDGTWVYEEDNTKPTYNVTGGMISSSTGNTTNIHSEYAYNAEGQAYLIRALTNAVVNAGGKGIFYWEPAWIPNANVGWASSGSSCTWSNQGFFSYDGKAMANLNLFAQMSPYI